MVPGQLSPERNASIRLPASLFRRIKDHANVGVFFGRYETATLFPVGGASINNVSRQTQVCSQVLAATAGQNISLQSLEQPVTVTFRLQCKEGMVNYIVYKQLLT